MSLINREALYKKACDLEAQALAYVGKIANDETKIEEWKIWSAILAERTAFKHDIFDAPSVQPEVLACGSGELNVQSEPHWIQCSETVDIPDHEILACDKYGEEMFGYLAYEDDQWLCVSDDCMMYDPIAWREKPEPYQEGE